MSQIFGTTLYLNHLNSALHFDASLGNRCMERENHLYRRKSATLPVGCCSLSLLFLASDIQSFDLVLMPNASFWGLDTIFISQTWIWEHGNFKCKSILTFCFLGHIANMQVSEATYVMRIFRQILCYVIQQTIGF